MHIHYQFHIWLKYTLNITSKLTASVTPGFANPPDNFNYILKSFHWPTPKSTGIFAYYLTKNLLLRGQWAMAYK